MSYENVTNPQSMSAKLIAYVPLRTFDQAYLRCIQLHNPFQYQSINLGVFQIMLSNSGNDKSGRNVQWDRSFIRKILSNMVE